MKKKALSHASTTNFDYSRVDLLLIKCVGNTADVRLCIS